MIVAISSVIFLFLADQVIKQWALQNLYNKNIVIVKNWFYLELFKNENIAFSLPLPPLIATFLSVIIILALIYYFIKFVKKHFGCQEYALLLIITGALSNLIDRLWHNAVIDYINFTYWPVFNVADIMISVGVALLLILLIKKKEFVQFVQIRLPD
ncbi:MAG: signal peptidase II [Candidatus Falkowbacteria bacterium]